MDDADEKTSAQPERAATVDGPSGDRHIATRSVVLHRPHTKKVKTIALLGRSVRTKLWSKPRGPERPPSIGSMQPPGRKK